MGEARGRFFSEQLGGEVRVLSVGIETKLSSLSYCSNAQHPKNMFCVCFFLQAAMLKWNKYADKKLEFYDQLLIDIIRKNNSPGVREFMRLLALCHTVMVEEKEGEFALFTGPPFTGLWPEWKPECWFGENFASFIEVAERIPAEGAGIGWKNAI